MIKKIKTVLFDFEGTLVDFQYKLKDFEIDLAKELQKMHFLSNDFASTKGYDQMINRAVELAASGKFDFSPEEVKERVGLISDRYDLDALSRWQPLTGTGDILTILRNTGFKLGLITNAGRKAIKEAVFRFKLDRIFHVTVTRNDVVLIKPSGQGILAALSALGAEKDEAVFIGDSISDILAARHAGVKVISLLGGQCAESELLEYNPDYIISSMEKVIEIVSIKNH